MLFCIDLGPLQRTRQLPLAHWGTWLLLRCRRLLSAIVQRCALLVAWRLLLLRVLLRVRLTPRDVHTQKILGYHHSRRVGWHAKRHARLMRQVRLQCFKRKPSNKMSGHPTLRQ